MIDFDSQFPVMINENLKVLGLNATEIALYKSLLVMGSSSASMLGKRADVSRTNARYFCHQLEKKGLVSVIQKKNTLFFSPEPLEKIFYLLNKERRDLDQKEEKLRKVVDELRVLMNPDIMLEKWVRFYEGVEGVKRVYEDTLIGDHIIYAFEDIGKIAPELKNYILRDYVPRRVKRGIFAKVLTLSSEINKRYRKQDSGCLRETKFIIPEFFPVETEINVYGNKTAFFSYTENQMFGSIIESSAIANTLKAIFSFCWMNAR